MKENVIYILCWGDFVCINKHGVSWQSSWLCILFSTDVSNTLVALLHLCQAE